MNIVFFGNQDNNAYRLCKWIRNLGLKPDIYIMKKSSQRSKPELVDVNLKYGSNEYPDWIHTYDNISSYWFLKNNSKLQEIADSADIIVTSGYNGLLAIPSFGFKPIIHLSLGFEVTELPFLLYSNNVNLPRRLISLWSRIALSKAALIVTGFKPSIASLRRLGYEEKTRIWGYPEDVDGNSIRVNHNLLSSLNVTYSSYDYVFLWLSRINLNKLSPSYKGTDHFLSAFAKIIKDNRYNVRAIIGNHGIDSEQFRHQVSLEKLDEHIDFVPHLPYWELLTYLSIKNAIIFDELDIEKGELSGIAREALSVGGVVIKTLDNDLITSCFGPRCPVIHAFNESTCYDAMRKILHWNSDQFEEAKREGLDWASEFLHYKQNTKYFLNLLSETIYLYNV